MWTDELGGHSEIGGDRMAREGSKCGRADELGCRRGHDDAHIGAGLDQPASQICRLVGSDATGNAENDPTPGEGHQTSSFSTVTLPSAISSMAIVRGLRLSEWT